MTQEKPSDAGQKTRPEALDESARPSESMPAVPDGTAVPGGTAAPGQAADKSGDALGPARAAAHSEGLLRGFPGAAAAAEAFRETGALGFIAARTFRALPRLDPKEVLRAAAAFGSDALSLALVIGIFVGFILVLFSNLVVSRFGVRSLFGWASGYAVLRELGPLVTSLVMCGRIGARNAAELGAMKIGGQLEGLTGVGVDPFAFLVAPRVLASALAVTALGVISSLTAIVSSIGFGFIISGIEPSTFMMSFTARVHPADLAAALVKLSVFGTAISLVSTQTGLTARGGARAIGSVAAQAVVQSAAALTCLDWGITFLTVQVIP